MNLFWKKILFYIISGIGVLHLWSFRWKPCSTHDSGKNNPLSYVLNKWFIFGKVGYSLSQETTLDYLLSVYVNSHDCATYIKFGVSTSLDLNRHWHHRWSILFSGLCNGIHACMLFFQSYVINLLNALLSGLQILGRCWGSSELWICSHSLQTGGQSR